MLPQTSQCWVIKELACDLWQEWMAKDTGIPLMASVARMVAKRLYGILNAMKNRV
ncbi:hypothetical protein GCM10011328_26050 [Hafnia psychrotolerans]|uniref:Transposase n=1 Tax=Hafnia psychrotolerans TaxID=1477018 RepID=A0ABQ1GSL5_9GAMM|nr:hypothetical protein GCM10011328_26050 [Hafnia psychrotolerans]